MGIDLVWFGILLAVNMQTSFMHPPFGLALFYLRSVAASEDYRDPVTRQLIPKVTTGQIYWGSIPFIIIQLAMVVVVMSFPGLVLHYKEGASKVDPSKIRIEVQGGGSSGNPYGNQQYPGADPGAGSPATQPQAPQGSPTPGNPYETTPPHAPAAPQ
jgi:hypothetical protein